MRSDENLANQYCLDKQDFLILQNKVTGRVKDRDGVNSSMLMLLSRSMGIAEYILNGNASGFRLRLKDSAILSLSLFQRSDNGEPIAKSLVAMTAYKDLLTALAAGELNLASALATIIGGRDKLEKYHDHPFDDTFGYTLKWFVLKNGPEMDHWLELFRDVCRTKAPGGFAGYVELFEAIRHGSREEAAAALPALIRGHERMSKRGIFALTADKHLCVWGLGLVNLARGMYGLDVPAAPPLIPADLLVSLG